MCHSWRIRPSPHWFLQWLGFLAECNLFLSFLKYFWDSNHRLSDIYQRLLMLQKLLRGAKMQMKLFILRDQTEILRSPVKPDSYTFNKILGKLKGTEQKRTSLGLMWEGKHYRHCQCPFFVSSFQQWSCEQLKQRCLVTRSGHVT